MSSKLNLLKCHLSSFLLTTLSLDLKFFYQFIFKASYFFTKLSLRVNFFYQFGQFAHYTFHDKLCYQKWVRTKYTITTRCWKVIFCCWASTDSIADVASFPSAINLYLSSSNFSSARWSLLKISSDFAPSVDFDFSLSTSAAYWEDKYKIQNERRLRTITNIITRGKNVTKTPTSHWLWEVII